MIICFNDKINSFCKINKKSFSLTQEYVQNLMPCCEDIHCKCPKCGVKSCFAYHGSYMRNITVIHKGKRYDFRVRVTRVICKSCRSTHALLPNFLVPYKLYTRDSILANVAESFSSSAIKVAETLETSIQLIYSFIQLVLSFFPHADSLNREQDWHKNFNQKFFLLNCITICNEDFDLTFFNRYKWIFLMTKFQNMKPPPVTIGVNLILPHNI